MSDQLTATTVVLEPAAQAFADATADPPYLFELGLVEGRRTGAEADGLRDEGVIQDFMVLNVLRETNGAGAAINQAIGFLGARLGT